MNQVQRRMLLAVVLLIAGLALGSTDRRGTVVPSDTLASGDSSHQGVQTSEDESQRQPEYVLKPWRALRSHLHNKIIHVPIGFALSAFFVAVLALKKPELQPVIRWLVLVAALGALGAFLTGSDQATAYDGSAKEWVINLHRELGIATAAALWIWWIVLSIRSLSKWALLAGLLTVALLTIAGFFGGVIAHG